SMAYMYRDRRTRKRDMRRLWITRMNAAARMHGVSYSKLMHAIHTANIDVDRKILAEMAVNDEAAFSALVNTALERIKSGREPMLITSPHNPRISKLQDLYTRRGRKKSGLFLMEGPHLLEVLLDAGIAPREVYFQPELLQRTVKGRVLLERLVHSASLSDDQLIEVSERVMNVLSDAQTAQGVVSVLPLDVFSPAHIYAKRLPAHRPVLLIFDNLYDP